VIGGIRDLVKVGVSDQHDTGETRRSRFALKHNRRRVRRADSEARGMDMEGRLDRISP
jgi:hypothetical protein